MEDLKSSINYLKNNTKDMKIILDNLAFVIDESPDSISNQINKSNSHLDFILSRIYDQAHTIKKQSKKLNVLEAKSTDLKEELKLKSRVLIVLTTFLVFFVAYEVAIDGKARRESQLTQENLIETTEQLKKVQTEQIRRGGIIPELKDVQ